MAKTRGLSKADLQLWAAFTSSIALLPGKIRLPVEAEPVPLAASAAPAPIVKPVKQPAGKHVAVDAAPPGLDKSTWRNFTSGKIRAVRVLDLHGMTAARAHHAVTTCIERAYAEQTRCVEIITGKGEILARELPLWLNTPALRPLILALAHPHAANTGSVRILLRRIR